ncbi:hypothetical protein EV714DRAFT_278455 [Schizophyllum commune]
MSLFRRSCLLSCLIVASIYSISVFYTPPLVFLNAISSLCYFFSGLRFELVDRASSPLGRAGGARPTECARIGLGITIEVRRLHL